MLDQVRVEAEVSRGAVTVVERRPRWRADEGQEWTTAGIARFRYNGQRGEWTLFWPDRNARWHRYDLIEPSPHIAKLLDEVESDPTGLFWG